MAVYPPTIPILPSIFNPDEFYKFDTGIGSLDQVLSVGNDASHQNIQNGGTFGCDALSTPFGYIDSLDASVLGDISTTGLSINPNGTLKIKGATTKGSLLVGDGTNTIELPTATNGLVLKTNSGTASGLEWGAGGGGGVTSITAGLNIGVDSTITTAPVIRVLNPLTSTLNLGTQAITGTTGYINFATASPTSEAQMSASLGFTTYDSITTAISTTLQKTGLSTQTTTDNINVTPTGITKSVGATTLGITSTTSPITLTPLAANDCNVVVSGAGKLHAIQSSSGGAALPICVLENTNADATAPHLDFYKNSASPANDDIVGAVSFHAKNASATSVEFGRISVTERDVTAGSENGSLSLFVCENSATPTEYLRANGILGSNDLYKPIDTRGNAIKNTTAGQTLTLNQTAASQSITLNNSGGGGITNTCPSGQFSVSSNNFSITGSSGTLTAATGNVTLSTGSTGVVIVSQNGVTTNKLRTDIANINYYPDFIVDNANSNSISVPPAQVYGEKLILVNKGVSPLINWVAYGSLQGGVGVNAMYACSNGEIYVARSDSDTINIWDSAMTSVLGSFSVGGSGAQRVYCFYEESGFMFVGGSFTSVNGNATPQINLTRININSRVEEPLEGAGYNGFGGYGVGKVNALTGYAGELIVGGDFTQIYSNGGSPVTCNYLGKVYNQTASTGSQNFYEVGNGVNDRVYALNNTNGYLFVGGEFTYVNNGFDNYQRLATWNGSWGYVGGFPYTFGGSVTTIMNTAHYPYLFIGGSFTTPFQYACYIDFTNPSTSPATDSGKAWSYAFTNNRQQFYNGNSYILTLDEVTQNTAYQTWVGLGTPPTGYNPSFIGSFNGELKVAYENNGGIVYSKTLASQTCAFSLSSGNFKYNGTLYTTYTLSLIDVAMEFLGDTTSSPAYWRPIGYAYAGGSFS
jgi:hypothetical protein